MTLPFDGGISAFFNDLAPDSVRNAIKRSDKSDIISTSYPHQERLARKVYEGQLAKLQIELVKMQAWAKESGSRVAIVFEGRDAAGKGGTIKRFRENLNPRGARVVALSKPTQKEMGEWYFQSYIKQPPTAGGMTFLTAAGITAVSWNLCLAFANQNSAKCFSTKSKTLKR